MVGLIWIGDNNFFKLGWFNLVLGVMVLWEEGVWLLWVSLVWVCIDFDLVGF